MQLLAFLTKSKIRHFGRILNFGRGTWMKIELFTLLAKTLF
jgi:hypothetical protein